MRTTGWPQRRPFRDAAWAYYWLDIPRERIRIVPVAQLFETARVP